MAELKMQLKTLIPNAVCTAPKWENGFVDIGFQSAVEADKAALTIINLQPNRTLPITRTRFREDENLYISFTKLPTTIPRQELIARLRNGLIKYGRIVEFEMEQDDLMPQCAMAKAIAIICPRDEIRQDKTLIPREAFFFMGAEKNSDASRVFNIKPEDSAPICAHCNALGHMQAACPKTVEGMRLLMSEDEMDTDWSATNDLAYEWGTEACYEIVEPVTAFEKKEAKRALKKKALEQKQEEIKLQQQKDIAEAAKVADQIFAEEERLAAKEREKNSDVDMSGQQEEQDIQNHSENQTFIPENNSQTHLTPNFPNQNFTNDTIHPQYDESHQNLNYNQSSSTHATHEESGFTQVPFSHQPNAPHVNDQHDSYNCQDESFNSTYNFENLDPNAILEESN